MRVIAVLLSVLGFGLVISAYVVGGLFWPLIVWLLFTLCWTLWIRFQWIWIQSPGLLLIICFCVLGFYFGFSPLLIYPGVFLAFAGWDLADFSIRLNNANPDDNLRQLKKIHLVRLGWALGIGLTLVFLTMIIRMQIPFGWMVLLSLLTALGLERLISGILKTE